MQATITRMVNQWRGSPRPLRTYSCSDGMQIRACRMHPRMHLSLPPPPARSPLSRFLLLTYSRANVNSRESMNAGGCGEGVFGPFCALIEACRNPERFATEYTMRKRARGVHPGAPAMGISIAMIARVSGAPDSRAGRQCRGC